MNRRRMSGHIASPAIAASEIQQFAYGTLASPVSPSVGGYVLALAGDPTATIAYDANAAAITSTLEALAGIGSGNVVVTGSNPFTVDFSGGVLGGTNVAQLTSGSITLAVTAPTVTLNVTQQGAADAFSPPTLGGSFTDGDDGSIAAEQIITFMPAATSGTWNCNGQVINLNDSPSIMGWNASGTAATGTVTLTKQDFASGQSPFSHDVGVLAYLSGAGQAHIFTVTLADGPDAGKFYVTENGFPVGTELAWNGNLQTEIGSYGGGYTVTGSGPWTCTSSTNVSHNWSGATSASDPLLKTMGVEHTTTQEGG